MAIQCVEKAFNFSTLHHNSVDELLKEGDRIRHDGSLKIHKTNDSRVDYLIDAMDSTTTWYFFLDGKCGALVEMEIPFCAWRQVLMRLGLNTRKVATPHASASSLMRGSGYPSFVYKMALNKGYVLMTGAHTKEAATLWQRVAEKTGARILYVNPQSGHVKEGSFSSKDIKVMVPKQLLSQIVTIK